MPLFSLLVCLMMVKSDIAELENDNTQKYLDAVNHVQDVLLRGNLLNGKWSALSFNRNILEVQVA